MHAFNDVKTIDRIRCRHWYLNFLLPTHLALPWSTVCSGHTVPRETGVARGAALVTLWCQTLGVSVTNGSRGLSHCPDVCLVGGNKFTQFAYS